MLRISGWIMNLFLAAVATSALAAVYDAPEAGNDIIGKVGYIRAEHEDTLSAIARRQNLGYAEIKLANPDVDFWLPGEGTKVMLPTRYILPDAPREGIVINIAEMRLYYYPPKDSPYADKIFTYPIGIGRKGWTTPLGTTRIVRTDDHPTWYPPASIRKEHAKKGDPLPKVVPPGPDNPLGQYALYLGFNSYLIHGTNKPAGIGMRVSHGCIRMYGEDIAALYAMVEAGTPVHIVYQPYKAGWKNGRLFLAAHPPDATGEAPVKTYTRLTETIVQATSERPDYPVDWATARQVATNARGIPVEIAARPPKLVRSEQQHQGQQKSPAESGASEAGS